MGNLQNQNLILAAVLIGVLALFLSIYAVWSLVKLNKLRRSFFSGKNGADLEEILHSLARELKEGQERQSVQEQALAALEHNFNFAIQKVGVVRFNPFDDGGGNFSFCLALLDGQNSGVVVTSMHGRQQNRIYTKKINQGHSDTQLTEEELEAVSAAYGK